MLESSELHRCVDDGEQRCDDDNDCSKDALFYDVRNSFCYSEYTICRKVTVDSDEKYYPFVGFAHTTIQRKMVE
jgi:hypothetical protein